MDSYTLSLSHSFNFSSGPGFDLKRSVTASVFRFSFTWVKSVGISDARVCLQVDSVAENWFAFLVRSTWEEKLEIEYLKTWVVELWPSHFTSLGYLKRSKHKNFTSNAVSASLAFTSCLSASLKTGQIDKTPSLAFFNATCRQCRARPAPLPQLPTFSCSSSTSPWCCHFCQSQSIYTRYRPSHNVVNFN